VFPCMFHPSYLVLPNDGSAKSKYVMQNIQYELIFKEAIPLFITKQTTFFSLTQHRFILIQLVTLTCTLHVSACT